MSPHDDPLLDQLREDHWQMAVLFQRLSEGFADGLDAAVLDRILDALVIFFTEHSAREEAWLAGARHPRLGEHKAEHADALALIRSVQAAGRGGRPLTRADIDRVSTLFTEVLFAADERDLALFAKRAG